MQNLEKDGTSLALLRTQVEQQLDSVSMVEKNAVIPQYTAYRSVAY